MENNFSGMSGSCKRVLQEPNRYLIDKIYRIDEGELAVVDNLGAQIDIALDTYKTIADATAGTGFKVNRAGALTVTQPITFAVRVADFSDVLERLGYFTRAPTSNFAEVMRALGASVPY